MKKFKLYPLVCIIICSVIIFSACEPIDKMVEFFADDGTGYIFKIALESDPENLDPQLSSDESSVIVAKNLYAGLMEYDKDGMLKGCMARDYTISEDGLIYTFYLKEGFKWHALGNYEFPVTAADFVFGFQRLMDPKTESQYSEKYFCIKNSAKARAGEAEVSEIGVEAVDDYTLKFTLEYQSAEFLYLLTELPAMPCCEDFFITSGGKYGLEAEAVCSNGPFFVRYWLHDPYGSDNYIRLRRNPGYSDVEYVSAGGINYLITEDSKTRISDFSGGSTDAILYRGGEYANIDGEEYIAGYADICGIVFNEKKPAFSSSELRQVFSLAIDRDEIYAKAPDVLLPAKGLVPENDGMRLMGYSSRLPANASESNPSMAEYKWEFLLDERGKSSLIGNTLMVPAGFEYSDYLSAVSDSFYSVFGSHIAIEVVNSNDYNQRLSSGNYDMVLAVLTYQGNGAVDYISPFGSEGRFNIIVEEAAAAEKKAYRSETLQSLNYAVSEAENAILSGYHFIPLWQMPTVCAYDDDCEDLSLDPFSKTVYFKDAKCY